MRKLTLSEWAEIGELIGVFAVFVSLLFVIFSINQNTAALHGSTENLLFEMHSDLASQFIADPTMASIMVEMRSDAPELTEIEAVRWEKYHLNLLDVWALAHTRHKRGLLGDDQWLTWDRYFAELFATGGERLSLERWQELHYGFDPGFWAHVGASLFPQDAN